MQNSTPLRPSPYPDSPFMVVQPLPWDGDRRSATVVLATDGNERSDGAVRIARARADAMGALLEVVTVLQAEPVLAPEGGYFDERATLVRRTARRRVIEGQLERVLGPGNIYSISVLDGNPAYTISRVAIERRAALVVVGLGRHLIAQRLFTDETALQLARIARVPVLAVPADTTTAPNHAVVAIDFSDISVRAAQAAIDAVADSGEVTLVHVMPLVLEDAFALESQEPYQKWAQAELAAVEAQLVVPDGVTVKRVAIRGRPAVEVLDYAARIGANLVATGTHGRGFVARAVLGSVTAKLLRGATCTLLTVPRDPLPALTVTAQDTAGATPNSPLSWSRLLNDFTRRNAGRRTILEVDDLEIGAQAQEYNYPLLGVSYSDRDGRVDLMLGDRFAGGRHLARTMGSVVAVDVHTDGSGHDVALRIQHGTSQTLLTFAVG